MIKSIFRMLFFGAASATLIVVSIRMNEQVYPFEKFFILMAAMVYGGKFAIELADFFGRDRE